MKISIKELRFEAVIGILEFERETPQPVEIECNIEYSYSKGEFLDYAEAAALLEATVKNGKFYLLEEALEELFLKMREKFPQIERIKITISKPDILPNCRVCLSDSRSYL
ncbi:MAG: dihydroneopterin aldolase [Hydrogenimonas sp.]|nr:dihydroneopterin aldolase [Hydrogenimonas sp.]